MKEISWWRWGREIRWKEMNELEGVGEEDMAIRELEQREWEKKEELCQERSNSMGQESDGEDGEEEVTAGATEMGEERKVWEMKERLWWRWGREIRWEEMNEYEGVGEEDVAIRESERKEWERKTVPGREQEYG